MQLADRATIDDHGVAALTLMQRAGHETAVAIRRRFGQRARGRISIFAGKGNNGGDVFVVARELAERAASVRVFFLGRLDEIVDEARLSANELSPHVPITPIPDEEAWRHHRFEALDAELLVDALFGTGLTRPLSGLAAADRRRPQCRRLPPIVAIDLAERPDRPIAPTCPGRPSARPSP